eukprot:COSAG05_NODE_21246_length_273_cov_0.764368_2_plen_22_part_01
MNRIYHTSANDIPQKNRSSGSR